MNDFALKTTAGSLFQTTRIVKIMKRNKKCVWLKRDLWLHYIALEQVCITAKNIVLYIQSIKSLYSDVWY